MTIFSCTEDGQAEMKNSTKKQFLSISIINDLWEKVNLGTSMKYEFNIYF